MPGLTCHKSFINGNQDSAVRTGKTMAAMRGRERGSTAAKLEVMTITKPEQ